MKNIYEQPKALFDVIDTADIVTASLNYSDEENASMHSSDIYNFSQFIG